MRQDSGMNYAGGTPNQMMGPNNDMPVWLSHQNNNGGPMPNNYSRVSNPGMSPMLN